MKVLENHMRYDPYIRAAITIVIGCTFSSACYADLPLTIESLTTDKGRFKLDTAISYFNQNSSNLLSQGSSVIDLGNGSIISIPNLPIEGTVNTDTIVGTIGLRYGISEAWELGIKANGIALEQRQENEGKVSSQNDTRLQDVSLTTQYQFTKNNKSLPDSLVFSELSLYDNTSGFKTKTASSITVGSTVYTVNDPIALSLTGIYQHNNDRSLVSVPESFPDQVDIGNVLSVSGSVTFAVNSDITLNTGVGWRMIEGDEFFDSEIDRATRTETSLNLGMAYALTERSNLTANLRTDVSGDSGSTLSLGMTTKLGKLPPPISQQYRKHKERNNLDN